MSFYAPYDMFTWCHLLHIGCYAYWCYPCFLCSLATKMDECYCGPHCCGSGGGVNLLSSSCFLPTSPNTFLVAMRSKLRAQHGIKVCLFRTVAKATRYVC